MTLGLWDLRAANCAIAAHAKSIIWMTDEVDTILNTHCIRPDSTKTPPYPFAVTQAFLCVGSIPGGHTVQGAAVKEWALRAYAAYPCSF